MNTIHTFYMLVIVLLAGVFGIPQAAAGQYYYYDGQQIQLKTDSTKILLRFDSLLTSEQRVALIDSVDRVSTLLADTRLLHQFVACSLSNTDGYARFVDSLKNAGGVERVEPFYLTANDLPLTHGVSFCVQFNPDTSPEQIDSINATHHVVICGKSETRPGVYYLRVTGETPLSLLETANLYYEMPYTLWSHPNFLLHAEVDSDTPYQVYDFYSPYQWQINRVVGTVGQASVWDFAGVDSTVVVAVLDFGVEAHEDLPAERLYMCFDGGPFDDNMHGQACAGIIAASHTTDSSLATDPGTGIISMAPHSLIMSVKVFPDGWLPCWGPVPDSCFTECIDYARSRGADVLSCSWHVDPPSDNIADALLGATTGGRYYRDSIDWLGCPVFFSSGNALPSGSAVNFPARLPCCFAVGAMDEADVRFGYSNYDSTLDVVAPSGSIDKSYQANGDVWTLDEMGWPGINPQLLSTCPSESENNTNYYCRFGGTSAASPVVAGTAALLISYKPELRYETVYDILRNSAVKDLDWGTLPDTPYVEYGYGRVDAFRAVLSIARGDINNDGLINLADISKLIDYVYMNGPEPFPSRLLGDCNCDSKINLADIGKLISYVYQDGELVVPCYLFE